MGFTLKAGMVEGNLFTENGKWKYNVAIDMTSFYHEAFVQDAVIKAYEATPSDVRGVKDGATGYWLVVFEPWHHSAYPVMVKI